MSLHVILRDKHQLLLFSLRYRFLQGAEIAAAFGPDFNENEDAVFGNNNIDFAVARAVIGLDNLISAPLEEVLRQFLAQLAGSSSLHLPK